MKLFITIITTFFFLSNCTINKQLSSSEYREGVPIILFCELPNYINQLVYVEGIYSGYEEYWSLTGNNQCDPNLNTELTFKNYGYDVPKKFVDDFRKVHNNYIDLYLNLKLIGRFDNQGKAYGHLGSNNSIFVVEEVIELKVTKTKS